MAKIDHISADIDELNYRNAELEKVIRELEYDKQRIDKQIHQVQGTIEQLNAELHSKEMTLRDTDNQVAEAQKTILALETDIKDLERLNEKNRNEAIQQQRAHQAEVTRNLELTARANSLDNTLRSRDLQAEDLRREIENLKHAHSNLLDTNFNLNKDLEAIRRQIDIMTDQNQQVILFKIFYKVLVDWRTRKILWTRRTSQTNLEQKK
mgnify:CR=1 FL=1